MAEELITQITSTMDEDNKSTRLISCRVMTRTFDTLGRSLDQDRLHNMYPDLLKRLDDSSDEVRVMVTHTFLAYFDCFQNNYEVDLYRAHLEALYKGLLVHLDDPEARIQEAVLSEWLLVVIAAAAVPVLSSVLLCLCIVLFFSPSPANAVAVHVLLSRVLPHLYLVLLLFPRLLLLLLCSSV